MTYIKNKSTIVAALIAGICSCTATIDIKTNSSEPVLTIYGSITDELKRHEIILSSSLPYFENRESDKVSGASVVLKTSEGDEFLMTDDSIKGLYRTVEEVAGKPGTIYTLTVETDFDNDGVTETYSAVSTMPDFYPADSINVKPVKMMGMTLQTIYFYADNPPVEIYVLPKFYVNDSLVTDRLGRYAVFSNEYTYGNYIPGARIYDFHDVTDYDKFDDERRERSVFVKEGDKITMDMYLIDKHYYDFIRQAKEEIHGENPIFGGPASNITTNIKGGAAGFFAAMCRSRLETVIK